VPTTTYRGFAAVYIDSEKIKKESRLDHWKQDHSDSVLLLMKQ